MSLVLVSVPVAAITIDESKYPDRDDGFVLTHLERYLRKFAPLPAVTLSVEDDAPTVVRRHKYTCS